MPHIQSDNLIRSVSIALALIGRVCMRALGKGSYISSSLVERLRYLLQLYLQVGQFCAGERCPPEPGRPFLQSWAGLQLLSPRLGGLRPAS